MNAPASEHLLAARLSYGPTAPLCEELKTRGLEAWLDEQLHPEEKADTLAQGHINRIRWPIEYAAGGEKEVKWPAVKEKRQLQYLDAEPPKLWALQDYERGMDYQERIRPMQEVRAATWVRAVYSRWQLREVLVQFWHNHFNVHAEGSESVAAMLPVYDHGVIRAHALGNFRAMLESVATSTAMLYYLDNVTSKASPANENYARELFELHTLGAAAYRNDLFRRWREVPGALEGKPDGYIDQDVYEAARAFTGWTVANGEEDDNGKRANDGSFLYREAWHDPYQKRVLATEFDPNEPPMADGKHVLDLVAAHPATSLHLCLKLCRRFLGDDPPADLVQRAAQIWRDNAKAPDQIAQVVRAIVLAPEFAAQPRTKVKNPMELGASFARVTGAHFRPTSEFGDAIQNMGYKLFAWPTPTGHPDVNTYWLGANTTVGRWNLLNTLCDEQGAMRWERADVCLDHEETPAQYVARWTRRMLGHSLEEAAMNQLAAYLAKGAGAKPDQALDFEDNDTWRRAIKTLAMIGASPEFQYR